MSFDDNDKLSSNGDILSQGATRGRPLGSISKVIRMNQPLANAELALMDLLWQTDDHMTARQIREQLCPDATKAQHGTVQRLLQLLERFMRISGGPMSKPA